MRRLLIASPTALSLAVLLTAVTHVGRPLIAASSAGCEGGGFTVTFGGGTALSGTVDTSVPAAGVGGSIQVRGRYVEFDIVPATFGITGYTLTGAANALDITGGVRTPVYAAKTPDHKGLTLTGAVAVSIAEENLEISRSGPGLGMKLQVKDCAQGGMFQMEPSRGDGGPTDILHVLADGAGPTDPIRVFYFDNPNFRAREGDVVPYKDTTVTVTARVNFANGFSRRFVGRDSPQVATRVAQGCPNQIQKRDGTFVTADHCGGVSLWRVSSGGRMGAVFGGDSTEVAPPATVCTHQCQAQNRVRGQAVNLGFPFPVPDTSRLNPRLPGQP